EVDPRLAHETEATEQQAVELWEKVNRPNAMIKIPATLEGLPAITATLAKGISVNVTLIFSLERYEQVIDAFIEGIAQADANGHDLKHIGSVASFFVSRVDTAVDNKLEEIGSDEAKALEGKAAIANARLAYELFENKFANDPRWAALEAKGAKKQRPLWASTGTKNPAYSDCVYVDELVAPLIVNTMPEKTLNALADHGNGAPTIKGTYEESHAIMAKLAELGIDFKAVTDKLEADGVASFIKSWDSVLTDVQAGIDRVNG
ncbi:transaldolase, partial [Enterococcus durans]|nr:transaldolase [Enterococcus durans]